MPDEAVELDEGAGIQQLDETLAGEKLALLALALDRLVGAGVLGLVAELLELIQLRLGRVGARFVGRRHSQSLTAARLGHVLVSDAKQLSSDSPESA
jgi:hypothetical protein